MFTGIVEETGTVRGIDFVADGARITIVAATALIGTRIGDSIAIDGACLTVVSMDAASFTVEATLETLRRTTLGDRAAGDGVHLERAMGTSARFGGHFVQGHIDAQGTIRSRTHVGDAVVQVYAAPPEVVPYLVSKGSIAVDGVSLTVVGTGDDWFDVWLIPHTIAVTHLAARPIGSRVNLEADILAKYVARAVRQYSPTDGEGRTPSVSAPSVSAPSPPAPLPPGGRHR